MSDWSRTWYVIGGLMLGVSSGVTYAAPSDSAEYISCIDRAGGVTADTINCIGQEIARQDPKLNQVYQQLIKAVTPTRQKQLRDAQRLWLKYREANCRFYSDVDGGSLARILANQCMLDMLIERSAELEGLKQIEGL